MNLRYESVVSGEPGIQTLENFLKTALMPVGTTLYVYGGGWNNEDTGACLQTRSIGIAPEWVEFFAEHDGSFHYNKTDDCQKEGTMRHMGLDCSGYVGWTLYNTFETENGHDGYVCKSTDMAKMFADRGWGTWTKTLAVPAGGGDPIVRPGDIVSIAGHVWISLGTCSDGSVVILHSTPSESRMGQPGGGVQISAVGKRGSCEAFYLADEYMSKYYPEWYARYRTQLKTSEVYFKVDSGSAGRFSWDASERGNGLDDSVGMQDKRPEEVLRSFFAGKLVKSY